MCSLFYAVHWSVEPWNNRDYTYCFFDCVVLKKYKLLHDIARGFGETKNCLINPKVVSPWKGAHDGICKNFILLFSTLLIFTAYHFSLRISSRIWLREVRDEGTEWMKYFHGLCICEDFMRLKEEAADAL